MDNEREVLVSELLKEYELPIKVRKKHWVGDFHFLITSYSDFCAHGEEYCAGKIYKTSNRNVTLMGLDEKVCLYGNNNRKTNITK